MLGVVVSDRPEGNDWWEASDGRWYPPESHPSYGVNLSADGTHKTCPACAESVMAAAVVCRYCGHDFRVNVIRPHGSRTTTNGLAVASLVLGIVWVYWIGSILAVIFGHRAKKQIDESEGGQAGRGMAVAGLILGWIGIGVPVLTVLSVMATAAT